MHISKGLPMAIKSRLILPRSLPHPDPETLPEREYEDIFSGGDLKGGFLALSRRVIPFHAVPG
jgi:hypothetical protein